MALTPGHPLLVLHVLGAKPRKLDLGSTLSVVGAHSSRAAPAMFPARSFARRAASAGPLGRRSTREQQMRSRPRSTQPRRLARAARSRAASPSQVCPVQTGQLPKQPAFRGAASRVDGTFPILSPPEKLGSPRPNWITRGLEKKKAIFGNSQLEEKGVLTEVRS